MCGVFGALSLDGHPLDAHAQLEQVAHGLRHRGPDGARLITSSSFVLGATRLGIIDLHARADQPWTSGSGPPFWLACNGEIYNSGALRRRFSDYPFRSDCDLEALLPLLAARGSAALAELDGMFALATWKPRSQLLTLARDRAGEKPLFYTEFDRELWFASEMAPLLLHPRVSREIDLIALSQYLQLGYVLEPRTLIASIRRVEAGTALLVRAGERYLHRYWQPHDLAQTAACRGDRIEQLRELLDRAIRKQVVADVPVGVFTSGGLDSSLVSVLAARALGAARITTFGARFEAASYDESPWARRCARITGTPHVEVCCGDDELRDALFEVGERSAEPISDPAVLPTLLLARAARSHVRVVLSGEGADELFGGYPTYIGHVLAPRYRNAPRAVRLAIERFVRALPSSGRKVTLEFLLRRFIAAAQLDWVERHLAWVGASLPGASTLSLASHWRQLLIAQYRERNAVDGAMLLDYCTELREKLLVKTDRATMLNSIEARAPFLDAQLTAFAFGLPTEDKVRGLTTKWILKQAAMPLLPRALVLRRKRGLSVPTAALINGALRKDVDGWLDPSALQATGLLDETAVRRLLAEHRAGHANHARALWPAVVLQHWAERWRPALTDRLMEAPLATGECATAAHGGW